jgi:hypothetical protein
MGRWSSIGTQYLFIYQMRTTVYWETMALPNNMKLIPQFSKLFTFLDKPLH